MGTHPSGPSYVVQDDQKIKLREHLAQAKDKAAIFGVHLVKQFPRTEEGDLPFLFKILSVNQALSIQAHPDLLLARKLHAEFPQHYKDDNHKPELTIALTKFEALCAFRTLEEIIANIKSNMPLQNLLGKENVERYILDFSHVNNDTKRRELLRTLFTALMTSDPGRVKVELLNLVQQLTDQKEKSRLDKLFLRLHSTYPGDVGCFAIYFLNYIDLEPGQALFLGPNEPHAYLYGDCVECMACSDNVVRAGLTPKFIHVNVLCDMLTYNDKSLENMYLGTGKVLNPSVHRFSPPVKEFMVDRVHLSDNHKKVTWKNASISIMIVVDGKATINDQDVKRGDIFLIHSNYEWTATTDNDCLLFVAAANDDLML
jgi:mannose-6-phosphate isomerase